MVLSTLNVHAGLFHQVKRRLEVEAGYSLGFKDGGGATEVQMPMASLEGKSKTVVHIIQQAVFKYIRSGSCITVSIFYFTF